MYRNAVGMREAPFIVTHFRRRADSELDSDIQAITQAMLRAKN
jgi:hypothetical protein